jgi:predicted DNA-binding transcriptional regulator AlpA
VNTHNKQKKPKRYLRKRAVAERYSVHERTVDRMSLDGRLPPPMYFTRFPIWDEDKLDASDRAAALLPRPTRAA